MTLLERCNMKSHKSRTLLVRHLTPFYFTISKPAATDPRAKHQALAPSLPMLFTVKSMFVSVLLTFNASARACGQKRWQTMPNMRIMRNSNAICDNIQPCPQAHNWNRQTAEAKIASKYEEIKVNFSWKDAVTSTHLYGILIIIYLALKMLCPFHFHLASIPCSHVKDSWKDPPEHHLIAYYSTIPKPGATDPRPKHQASAPSSPMLFSNKSIFVNVLLTFNASARACGQNRCQTMSNMRTFNGVHRCVLQYAHYLAPKLCRFLGSFSEYRDLKHLKITWSHAGIKPVWFLLNHVFQLFISKNPFCDFAHTSWQHSIPESSATGSF